MKTRSSNAHCRTWASGAPALLGRPLALDSGGRVAGLLAGWLVPGFTFWHSPVVLTATVGANKLQEQILKRHNNPIRLNTEDESGMTWDKGCRSLEKRYKPHLNWTGIQTRCSCSCRELSANSRSVLDVLVTGNHSGAISKRRRASSRVLVKSSNNIPSTPSPCQEQNCS